MKTLFTYRSYLLTGVVLLLLGLGNKVWGATSYTWTGNTSSAWATTTNWSPNGNPGSASGDIVNIGVTAFTGSQPLLTISPTIPSARAV